VFQFSQALTERSLTSGEVHPGELGFAHRGRVRPSRAWGSPFVGEAWGIVGPYGAYG
jgi:hypothetical protein